jgi:ditrans,polycis-polyprenyl diphosphate synthase
MIDTSLVANPILGILFCLLHVTVSLVHIWSYLIYQVNCLIISSGLLPKYQNLNLDQLQHLAVVIDSEEANDKNKIQQLLFWLANLRVKYVTLYDIEGNKLIIPAFDFITSVIIIFYHYSLSVGQQLIN